MPGTFFFMTEYIGRDENKFCCAAVNGAKMEGKYE